MAEPPHRNVLPLVLLGAGLFVSGCACFQREAEEASIVAGRQLSLRGIDAQQSGRWEEAERLFAMAVGKNPADERAHCHYAQVLWQQGKPAEALHHLRESVRLSGGDPQLCVQLGQMYLQRGELDSAWHCAEEAIATNCRLACAWALRGDVLRQQGQWDAALESYHRALVEQPRFADVQMATADVYWAQNRPRRALATLESLESHLRPAAAPAELLYREGLAYKALGRYQDAVSAFSAASQQPNPSAELFFQLGEAQLLAGNTASARLAVQAALQHTPDHQPSLQLLARLDRQQQSLTAAK